MKVNMGLADRLIRILAAVIISVLYSTGIIGGTLAIVLLTIAGAFIITGSIGVCPLYLPFGLSTLRRKFSGKA